MWKLFICVLFITIAADSRAQTSTTSLYITLSDIQSIKINNPSEQEAAINSPGLVQNADVKILNPSGSQVHWYNSQSKKEKLISQDVYADTNSSPLASFYAENSAEKPTIKSPGNTEKRNQAMLLMVCQIAPR